MSRNAFGRLCQLLETAGGLRGNYYLCDNGYGNVEGFLTPYRGVRYHLKEWDRGTGGPQSPRELFNLRHASARNVIERTFGLLKTRWGILRSPSYYPIRVQNQIIVACCLLHNFVRMEMLDDPLEEPSHISTPRYMFGKNYGTLMGMMGKSGFGCDDSRSMITVDSQDVWDEYCKIDSSVRTMRYKSWPFFPAWLEIFSKDRAIGEVIVEAGALGDIQENVDHKVTSTVSQKKPTSSEKKHKKINTIADDGLTDAVNTFCDTANQRLSEIGKNLFVDYEEVEKRCAMFAAVGSIPGIDLNEQILISDRLVENLKKWISSLVFRMMQELVWLVLC
ncbi:UNVERIFIED_CONTAM: hypothetical protein Scaly_0095900 [Sesamum calycinum]|uniref:DDE Tnp4 domain-containing protein n=1 Tax=Sesamum calycinum TaxID=2727403 RepID=A0AAW2SVK0_9LAMI